MQLLISDLRRADMAGGCELLLDGELPLGLGQPGALIDIRIGRWLERAGGEAAGELRRLAGWGPAAMRPDKALLCLIAMAQSGLVGLERDGGALRVRALHRGGKADLDASGVMVELRRRCEEYRERRRKHD